MRELRARLGEHILRVRPTGLRDRRAGELVTAAVQGVDALEAYFARYLPQAVLAVCVPLLLVAWVLPRDLAAGIVLLVTVPLIPVFMVLIGLRRARERASAWRTPSPRLGAHFVDVVRGLETLRAHDRDRAQATTLAGAGEAYRPRDDGDAADRVPERARARAAARCSVRRWLRRPSGSSSPRATSACETGLAVLILAPELYQPIRELGAQFHAGADGLVAAEQILAVLDEPPGVRSPHAAAPGTGSCRVSELVLDRVTVSYPGRGRPVARRCLVASSSRASALRSSGASGERQDDAGVAASCGCSIPTTGRCGAAGSTCATSTPSTGGGASPGCRSARRSSRRHSRRTSGSAYRARPRRRCVAAIASAALDPVVASLPHGVATLIGEGGRRLSAGEAQRVALARAFLRDAPLLVARRADRAPRRRERPR